MAVEEARMRLRPMLEEMFGAQEAAILMDRPPGGWSELATHRSVDALAGETGRRFDAMAAETGRRFDAMAGDMDRRFDAMAGDMDRRFDAMGEDMDRRFDAVDRRFVELEVRFDLKLESLEHKFLGAMERGFRGQTWRLVTAMGAFVGIFAAIVKL